MVCIDEMHDIKKALFVYFELDKSNLYIHELVSALWIEANKNIAKHSSFEDKWFDW